MGNESTGLPSADDAALAEIAGDRRALVRAVTRTNAWFCPGLAILSAVMVRAPTTGSVWCFIALLAASFALVVAGRAGFALLCAAVTFVARFVAAWSYDASLRSEVAHAG
jgi:hypothetical protein